MRGRIKRQGPRDGSCAAAPSALWRTVDASRSWRVGVLRPIWRLAVSSLAWRLAVLGPIWRVAVSSRIWRLAALWIVVSIACSTPREPLPMPHLESWGNLNQPFGDSLDAAAWAALGPQPREYQFTMDPIRLEDYWIADASERNARVRRARGLRERAETLHKMSLIDSLGLYLEAIRVEPLDIKSYEQASRILLDRGAAMRAHALAAQAIRLDPRNGALWFLLGQAYVQRGKDGRARVAFEHALQSGGAERTNVAEALAILYVQEQQSARAESLLVAAQREETWLMAFSTAKQARAQGDLDGARQVLQAATQGADVPAALFVELGSVEHEAGNLEASDAAYRAALRISPYDRSARNGLGVLQWGRGNLRAAVSHFRRLLVSDPYDFVALFNFGGATLQLAQQTTPQTRADSLQGLAEKAFTTCVEYGHQTESALLGRSHSRLLRRDFAGSTADAEKLLDSPTHAARARLILARGALSQGSGREAANFLGPDFESDTLDAEGLWVLGKAYLDTGEPAKAAEVLSRLQQLQPQDWKSSMNLAVALSRSGDLNAAERILAQLAEQRPNDVDVLQNLAAVLDRLGRYKEVNELMRRIERLQQH